MNHATELDWSVRVRVSRQHPRHPDDQSGGNSYSLSKTHHDKWASPPLHTRSTISADLVDDEESTDDATSSFYSGFLRSSCATDRFGKDPLGKYSIRDTVLLTTNVLFEGQALVLLSPCRRSLPIPVAHSQMFANIHWFLRPAELAQTRTKREHLEV